MHDDPLTYLLDRFATDATTLRARAAHLAGKNKPEHGPDADASIRMAEACEDVLALLNNIPAEGEAALLDALDALGPELHALSERATDAFVRSVYGGASTRISEVVRKARGDEAGAADGDEQGDEPGDADLDLDDDDVDDDDLVDDDLDADALR